MSKLPYRFISIVLVVALLLCGALAGMGAFAEGEPEEPPVGGGPEEPPVGGGPEEPPVGGGPEEPPVGGGPEGAALLAEPASLQPDPVPDPIDLTEPELPPSPFPANGEATQIVDVWTRPGSKGKVLTRLYAGDGVTVLGISGLSAHIKYGDGEGYANMNRLAFEFAEDIPAKATAKGSLYTMPKKGVTGEKIKDSSFKQNDEFFATSRLGKWIHVYQVGGNDGWILATKLKLQL